MGSRRHLSANGAPAILLLRQGHLVIVGSWHIAAHSSFEGLSAAGESGR
jgi:hypothetical protein